MSFNVAVDSTMGFFFMIWQKVEWARNGGLRVMLSLSPPLSLSPQSNTAGVAAAGDGAPASSGPTRCLDGILLHNIFFFFWLEGELKMLGDWRTLRSNMRSTNLLLWIIVGMDLAEMAGSQQGIPLSVWVRSSSAFLLTQNLLVSWRQEMDPSKTQHFFQIWPPRLASVNLTVFSYHLFYQEIKTKQKEL